ncbi:hypothetical protein [Sporosarcina sp. A2]|uniref:hypothetical protein n=1 Tax=Sporosarcina sp. A2 TaxID=3393449 RepID=UPI003D7A11B9
MLDISGIPVKYLNQFAKASGVKYRGREQDQVLEELVGQGKEEDLKYLIEQFKFPASYLSILKPESNFPDISKTPELFIDKLVQERIINRSNVNTEWQPSYNPSIKLCAIKHEGSSIYIKLVEERFSSKKVGYSKSKSSYAYFTSLVLHFGTEELIELRCSMLDAKKYADFIMNLMGFASYKWIAVPKLTKEAAKTLCSHLSAGVASTHIALPTTVGSVKFNGKKGVNLKRDNTFELITAKIKELGLPTDDTMDENCFYSYTDTRTGVVIEVKFEVNIKMSYFKFTSIVPEGVVDHVLDTLVLVNNGEGLISTETDTDAPDVGLNFLRLPEIEVDVHLDVASQPDTDVLLK